MLQGHIRNILKVARRIQVQISGVCHDDGDLINPSSGTQETKNDDGLAASKTYQHHDSLLYPGGGSPSTLNHTPPNENLKPIFGCHPASRRVRGSRRNRNPPFLNPRGFVVRGHRVVVAGVVATHLDTAGCRSFFICRSFTHSRSLRSRFLDRSLLSQILNPQRSGLSSLSSPGLRRNTHSCGVLPGGDPHTALVRIWSSAGSPDDGQLSRCCRPSQHHHRRSTTPDRLFDIRHP